MVRTNGRRLEEKEEEGSEERGGGDCTNLTRYHFFSFSFKMPYQGGKQNTHSTASGVSPYQGSAR